MSWWRLRDPGSFPSGFHEAMQRGVGEDKVAGTYYTREALKAAQREWRLFRYSLRHHPFDPCYANEVALIHRTRKHWNEGLKMFQLLVTTRKNLLEDCVNLQEVLGRE